MQERDEDLYQAYQDIDALEKKVAEQNETILIRDFILGVIALLFGVFIFIKIKTGGISSLLFK
jgi:hypothetical protein